MRECQKMPKMPNPAPKLGRSKKIKKSLYKQKSGQKMAFLAFSGIHNIYKI